MKIKGILLIVLSLSMAFILASCGSDDGASDINEDIQNEDVTVESETESETEFVEFHDMAFDKPVNWKDGDSKDENEVGYYTENDGHILITYYPGVDYVSDDEGRAFLAKISDDDSRAKSTMTKEKYVNDNDTGGYIYKYEKAEEGKEYIIKGLITSDYLNTYSVIVKSPLKEEIRLEKLANTFFDSLIYTSEPISSGYTKEDSKYLTFMNNTKESLNDALGNFKKQLSTIEKKPALINDEGLTQELAVYIEYIDKDCDSIIDYNADDLSAELQKAHEQYISAAKQYKKMTTAYNAAVDDGDADQISKAVEHMKEGAKHMEQADSDI